MPAMLVVLKPVALAWARSVRIDEAIGSLVNVRSDQACASSGVLSALPVSVASSALASDCAVCGLAFRKAVVASWPLSKSVTTEGWAERKSVVTTSRVVENKPFGQRVLSLTRT